MYSRAARLNTDNMSTSQCVQRSIQDIASSIVLAARSPIYVGEPVNILVLMRTFWNGLDYHVAFNDEDAPRRISYPTAAPGNASLSFLSPANASDGQFVWVTLTHRYLSAGTYVVRLIVSGQLTLRGPTQRAEVTVDIVVRDWPSLGDVIGHVTLASQPESAYVGQSVKFVYAVENYVANVNYRVQFGNEPETAVR